MAVLWKQPGGRQTHPLVTEFTSADQVLLDLRLVEWDIYGSLAHARMLLRVGLLDEKEFSRLLRGCLILLKRQRKGKFVIRLAEEDGQTALENALIKVAGSVGKKIHAGRSRNDQVLVAMRLFLKQHLFEISRSALYLAGEFMNFAKKEVLTPMPGYTHMQRAMPSSVGLWASSFAWGLLDDLSHLRRVLEIVDQCPLGSGAGYGVPLPNDRLFTSRILGFGKPQMNVLSCQSFRGKIEYSVLSALSQIMLTLSVFAQDVLLFTTAEYDFVSLDESLLTGSSIMPQKRNADILELVRARAHTVSLFCQQSASISAGLPSGYNRDFQEIKGSLVRAVDIVQASLAMCSLVIGNLGIKKERMVQAMSPGLFAAHRVSQMVRAGTPFRGAYHKVKHNLVDLPRYEMRGVLRAMDQLGGPGQLALNLLGKRIHSEKIWWEKHEHTHLEHLGKLVGGR